MIRIVPLGLLVILSVILAGCIRTGLPKEALIFTEYDPQGLVVGSITINSNKPQYEGYGLFWGPKKDPSKKKKQEGVVSKIFIRPGKTLERIHIGELDGGKTYLFAIKDFPGQSELEAVSFFTNGASGSNNVLFKDIVLDIPIQKGEITYLGNVVIDDYASRKEVRAVVVNNSERDLNALKERYPHIDWAKARVDSTLVKL